MLFRGIQGVAEDVFIHVMAMRKMEEDELYRCLKGGAEAL
jgi:hypothetical protein